MSFNPTKLADALDIQEVEFELIEEDKSLPSIVDEEVSVPELESDDDDENIDRDFEYIRSNQIAIIESGKNALEGIVSVAGSSEHPRAYEVVSTIMNTISNANKQLLELYDLKRKAKEKVQKKSTESEDGGGTIHATQNNFFVGTTSDLIKRLKEMKEDES